MIVIPMAGLSRGFFLAGYEQPSYQLPLTGETMFAQAIKCFKPYFNEDHFVFLVRSDHGAVDFVHRNLKKLGVRDYSIEVFNYDTRGPAHTVYLGLQHLNRFEDLFIVNMDSVRKEFRKIDVPSEFHASLEITKVAQVKRPWVQIDASRRMIRSSSIEAISSWCSTGLFYFRRVADYLGAFEQTFLTAYPKTNGLIDFEILPMYDKLIGGGKQIYTQEVSCQAIQLCGTPEEYLQLSHSLQQAS